MDLITLSHGSGGEETNKLIKELFFKYFSNPILDKMEDSAVFEINSKVAFTTDSFTISPLFFNGGDIGKLAVVGTINDLAVMGAKPLYIGCSFIIEEGFRLDDLEKIVKSMVQELKKVDAKVITGDTKVVPKGTVDKIFINTSGIGKVLYDKISASNLEEGDVIIVSGTIGDHGACIFAQREEMDFQVDLSSDCNSVWSMVEQLINANIKIKAMRDPTRGGLSAVLNEWAKMSDIEIEVLEDMIPVKKEVLGICELVGFEPYILANEGRVVIAVSEDNAQNCLNILRSHPDGRQSQIIGRVKKKGGKRVLLKTSYGAVRVMEPPTGELLPRIC